MSEFLKIVQAVKSANTALPNWQKTEFSERVKLLEPLVGLMELSQGQLLEAFAADSGAPSGRSHDLKLAIPLIKELLIVAEEAHSQKISLPVGLVGIITGSQNPFTAALQKIVSALTQGNCVIWKPSEFLPKTNQQISNLFKKLELPEGVLNLAEGEESVGLSLIQHPAIHYISFSGSSETGAKIQTLASEAGKHFQLSMSARNASIIFADVDLKTQMAEIVQSAFDSHGLGRWRASRIFVQESFYKNFLDELRNYLSQNKMDYLGSISQGKILSQFKRAFDQAISENGKDLMGQEQSFKAVYDLTHCSTLQQEEILGPLITISSFKYQFDAIKFANTSPLGRAAYVWSSDLGKSEKVARKLEVGRVFINSLPKRAMPRRFQAAKNSGFGGEGLLDFLEFVSFNPQIE